MKHKSPDEDEDGAYVLKESLDIYEDEDGIVMMKEESSDTCDG